MERLPRLLGSQFETHNEESCHEEACVSLLVKLRTAMMENADALVLLVLKYFIEFDAVPVHLCEVEWAEILVVALIY